MTAPDGLLVVDKPPDWTSHDVVARARRLCQTRKVGHAGTLDPMATGVLVLGVGRATKLLTFLVGCDKDYSATIRLGQATVTDDAQGEVTSSADASALTNEAIEVAVGALTGEIAQVPSSVSAIKVNGERSYHRVRAGEAVELAVRRVTVARFGILARRDLVGGRGDAAGGPARHGLPDGHAVVDLDVLVTVSSGTYVRALARDLGEALGLGGHLTALRRTRVGGIGIADAHGLAELGELADAGTALPVVPLADAARAFLPVRDLSVQEARALSFGQRVDSQVAGRLDPIAAIGPDGCLVAVLDESGQVARARVVFTSASS